MKRKKLRRILAGVLSAATLFAVSGCAPETNSGNTAGENSGALFTEPTELDLVISSHVSWPYNENWDMWRYVKEATGATLNITAIPGSDISTKLSLMMSNASALPDLLHTWQKRDVDDYATSGAYISYEDHMDEMPNFSAFLDSVGEEKKNEMLNQHRSGDGKIYSAPTFGSSTAYSNIRTWIYRKDIFEKHGLEVPKTYEELYQVAKKLKELYPDSYPICFRNGIGKIGEFGPSWQKDMSWDAYYDFSDNTWKYGLQQPVMKEIVEYFIKLREEGIVSPDFIDLPTKSWEELMSTGRGFITLDYVVRIDFFNSAVQAENPEYMLAMMEPPMPDVEGASQKMMKADIDASGYCVCNTGDEEGIANSFKFVDWLFTDEAAELMSWGKENETYEVVDGKRKFLIAGDENPSIKFGIGTYGLYQRMDETAIDALYSEEQVSACRRMEKFMEPQSNPVMWMSLTDEESKRKEEIAQDLFNYALENLSKILLGQTPMSEWDNFQQGLVDMGVNELLEIYDGAYKRIVK